jgi:hypothetical protein
MKHESASYQADLFEVDEPQATPAPAQKALLASLVEALLIEIAVALASGEVGDDQDHG